MEPEAEPVEFGTMPQRNLPARWYIFILIGIGIFLYGLWGIIDDVMLICHSVMAIGGLLTIAFGVKLLSVYLRNRKEQE